MNASDQAHGSWAESRTHTLRQTDTDEPHRKRLSEWVSEWVHLCERESVRECVYDSVCAGVRVGENVSVCVWARPCVWERKDTHAPCTKHRKRRPNRREKAREIVWERDRDCERERERGRNGDKTKERKKERECAWERERERENTREKEKQREEKREKEKERGKQKESVGERQRAQRARMHTLTKTQKHLGPCTGVTGRVAVIATVARGARRLGVVDPLRARRRGVEVIACVKYLDVNIYAYTYASVCVYVS